MGVTCSFIKCVVHFAICIFLKFLLYIWNLFCLFFWDCLRRIIPRGFVYPCDVFDTIHDQTMSMLVLVDLMFPYLGTALWVDMSARTVWTCADQGHEVVESVSPQGTRRVHGLRTVADPGTMVIAIEPLNSTLIKSLFVLFWHPKWEAWCSLLYGFNPCSSRSFPPQRPCGQMQRLKTRRLDFEDCVPWVIKCPHWTSPNH